MRSSTVTDAFSVLGLQEGSSLDLVKTTYRQIALRIHPDKNPDNPAATAEFQRVSEAYSVLMKHLDQSSKSSGGFRPSPQYSGFSGHSFYGYNHSDDDDDDDDYDYYEDEFDSDDDIAFYLWLFQEMMNRGRSGGGPQYRRADHRTPRQEKPESPEQFQERVRRTREEQTAAHERRKREDAARKARAAREKEQERLEAEKRQKDKIESKKVQANAARKFAEDKARQMLRKAQDARSVVFAAARAGEADKVKKGIWENSVDAAGGEIKPNCAAFARNKPQDLYETLLHIATKNNDVDLINWLDLHNADPEERNSQHLTAFQLALQMGHVAIANYFFENYPPEISDHKDIYDCASCPNLISLALESHDPELVWLILDRKLATSDETRQAWEWASSEEGRQALEGENPSALTIEKAEDIVALLERYGNIQTPVASAPLPVRTAKKAAGKITSLSPSNKPSPPPSTGSYNNRPRPGRGNVRGRGRGRGRGSYHSPSH
ncbi:DnaJ-domain-containing protein [Pholiota conissans]|uniref:DnaJ-domain-containing protein n=1 Tax=Pholiota conissans TaxID=109636 RepID=A0A9P5YVF1_9AGAR|nr:DnaJ-domain-containing protein [Pholiota conissans]